VVMNRCVQSWCMPSARMVKTVCVASNNPTASQIDATQNH